MFYFFCNSLCNPGYALGPSGKQCIGMFIVHVLNKTSTLMHIVYLIQLLRRNSYIYLIVFLSLDINECDQQPCQGGICKNFKGGHTCSCLPGFTLGPDGRTCLGKYTL